jgi:Asp-tRNA(Asn)/Glu-tRNA(Gln) amidotransferase A subunit family amidase
MKNINNFYCQHKFQLILNILILFCFDAGLPPLHGVPCSVKEVIGLKGKPQTSGLWLRRNTLAEEDATVVKRLREAGAIPICMTNISELCMWMESDNLLYGLTRNPYNTAHTVGGSSGGEGKDSLLNHFIPCLYFL